LSKADFHKMSLEILDLWKKEQPFEKLARRNRGGEKFSFIDGPITANNPMGVHHAWGRTLKDIYQRYYGMKGFDQRYQNGYDCQGLWVEVEVEKALGLKGKQAIEEMGLDKFSRMCRERVYQYSAVQQEQSIQLGQWMDWGNNYFTLTDVNIRYIWLFLRKCAERGWLVRGQRPMPWCTRCGTSLSQHEVGEGYKDVEHQAVFCRFPIKGRDNEYLMVWTTTPWTLIANVAAAVHPELPYARVKQDGKIYYLSRGTMECLEGDYEDLGDVKGADLEGIEYEAPFEDLPKTEGVEHRVVFWKEIGEAEGTGIVHIAPGCGLEDHELGKEIGLEAIAPIDDNGLYYEGYGPFTGMHAGEVAPKVFEILKQKGMLYKTEAYKHSYPHCWRDGSELVFRLVTEWFISPDKDYGDGRTLREHLLAAAEQIEWNPPYMKHRMGDWLTNMESWCISRKRFWGIPLPFYTNDDESTLYVVGTKEELAKLAIEEDKDKVEKLPELHRPWIDDIRIKHPETGEVLKRVKDVGDCWLDAGIVPYSTCGYKDLVPFEEYKKEQDEVNRADSRALFGEKDWGHEYWKEWFPGELVCEMRAQIRCWFYAMLFMSVALEDCTPYKKVKTYEEVRDEKGDEMHKSTGNAIWFDDAVEKAGPDVLRWLYAGAPSTAALRFGFHVTQEIARKLLSLWNVFEFYKTYSEIDKPEVPFELKALTEDYSTLDRWILSRLQTLVETSNKNLDEQNTHLVVRDVEGFLDDLSNWYIRRNRRRFWRADMNPNKQAAYNTLSHVLLTLCRLTAPIIPFMTEHIYQEALRAEGWPESVHLCPYPEARREWRDEALESRVALAKEVAYLGLSARNAAKMKVRQPLSRLIVVGKPELFDSLVASCEEDLREELNVKKFERADSLEDFSEITVKPDFAKIREKFGGEAIGPIRGALASADGNEIAKVLNEKGLYELPGPDGASWKLTPEDVLVEKSDKKGFQTAESDSVAIALDVELTPELKQEGLVRDVIRHLQVLRKDTGLKVEQRIQLGIEAEKDIAEALEKHLEEVKSELLAEECRLSLEGFQDAEKHTVDMKKKKFQAALRPMD
jgi:isoleucyl-tRNA synthetase